MSLWVIQAEKDHRIFNVEIWKSVFQISLDIGILILLRERVGNWLENEFLLTKSLHFLDALDLNERLLHIKGGQNLGCIDSWRIFESL
ncbi:unnamed protein product [Rhizophagus irregularis]|nr:unnamed protein product [Rhizophagus irregularis]